MAGHSINIFSTMQCPHGGKVQAISTNTRTLADGAFMATANDVFTIAGCPLTNPCVTVRWLVPDFRVKVNGSPTLSRSSVGLCLNAAQAPQGAVVVVATQTKVQSM